MAKVMMKIMKKNLFVAAAMMVAMTACVKEADVNVNVEENVPQTEEKVWVEFTTGTETKAALQEGDGTHKIVWEVGDEISINEETFKVTEITEDGLKATFGAFVAADFTAPYTAVYPASAGTSFDELIVNNTPAVVAGGFDDIVSVAYSDDTSLQFKHVTSLLKFQVPSGFSVNTVTISADDALAGKVSVTMADEKSAPAITEKDAVKEVTLTGTFTPGQNYYVAVLPGTKTNLTVSFNGGLFETWKKDAEIKQGRVANMGVLSAPNKSNYGLIGVNGNWGPTDDIAMYETTKDNFYVAYGVEVTSGFKVRKAGGWDDNYNFGTTSQTTKSANSIVGVYTDGGSTDINVANGTYDIYFDRLKGQVYIMTPGKFYKEATSPATNSTKYSIIGTPNWDTDTDLYYSGDNIWTGVYTFAANNEWKIRKNHAWNGGDCGYSSVYPGSGLATDSGGNIKMKTAGTYVIGFVSTKSKITLVTK